MKKLLLISIATILTASFVHADESTPVKQKTTVNGGSVHFVGELVNAACTVSTDTANQTVDLGQHRTADITAIGQYTSNVPFQIKLVDCDPSVSATAKFAFNGSTVATDPTVLSVSSGASSNATAATGVGIEINDSKGKVLTPDGTVFSNATTMIDGNNTINFVARYKSTAAKATAGQANADANFVISFE